MEFPFKSAWQSRIVREIPVGSPGGKAIHFCSVKIEDHEASLKPDAEHFFSYWKEEEELAEDVILLLHLQRKRQEPWNENHLCVFQQLYELDPKRKEDRIRGCTWKGESESLEWLSLMVPGTETPLEVIAQHFGAAVVSPQEPMRLDVLQIPKPWGYEGWYTGVEKRGVALIHDRFGRTELPYALGLFPEPLLNGADEQLILLKTLNPVREEVLGDLYLEMHEKKWEVYVVTALDPQAWPSGKGEILAGLNPEVISRYRERYGENWSESCLRDFQEQIREYEKIRRELDQLLDRLKQEIGLSESEAISPEFMTELEQKLPEDLRQKEKELRQKAYAYIGRVSVEVGDVVTFPALQVHSLQHGIRVIEFQTPHYERLIVMFAQKVLTQNHWDTDRAMDLINTEPYRLPKPQLLMEEDGYLEERIVDFPDFSSERIRMDENISRKFQCEGRYHLIICVKGKLRLESQFGSSLELLPEEAVFLPASTSYYRVTNSGADSMIFLRAVPVSAHSAKLD